MLTEKIHELTERYSEELYEWRKYLHKNPELSFEETNTAKFICERLAEMGIEHTPGVAGTGVTGLIRGGKPGRTLLLRADMDALPVQEETGLPFSSEKPGVMHACGHDGHVAQLLCAARILNELRGELCGNVKLAFQPAEENGGGARLMIEAGVLENPHVDASAACHLWGPAKAGTVTTKPGPVMAATDTFFLTLKGKGGHGAMPHLAVDPVVMASDFVMQLQTIASRRVDPQDPVVLTCGSLHAGQQHNVIPGEAKLAVSVRMFSDDVADKIEAEVRRIANGVAESYGGSYELDYRKGFPALINDKAMAELALRVGALVAGEKNAVEMRVAEMSSEDFAFFAQRVPSVFFYVGISEEGEAPAVHHHPMFQFHERHLKTAAECLACFAVSYLREENN